MKRLLICTIMRNAQPHLDRYLDQLGGLRAQLKGHYEVELSIYENDSTDGTAEWLQAQRNTAMLHEHILGAQYKGSPYWITTAKLGTTQYPSIWSLDRLRNLAAARQECLNQVGDALGTFDKVAFIEPDVTYDPHWAAELILARHPLAAGLGEPDIYSGWSLRSESHPKEACFLYDTCATRASPLDLCWDIGEEGGQWRGKSLVPTSLGGVDSNCLHRVWSTFNCFCVYNARPFKEGLKWGYVNTRLNTGQLYIDDGDYGSGWLDCDTSVMCETFRARGYNGVYLNTNVLVRHA